MLVKGQSFKIETAKRDEQGKQWDGEEKPTERILETEFAVTLANGQSVEEYTKGKASGFQIPQSVAIVGKTIEFASGMKNRCANCAHFDQEAFQKWKTRMDLGNAAERAEVNGLRGMLLDEGHAQFVDQHTGTDGDIDVEHALNCCGICRELTSIWKEEAIVWPDSGCPDYRGNEILPIEQRCDYSYLFRPRDRSAVTSGNAAYDAILKAAAGVPTRRAQRVSIAKFLPQAPRREPLVEPAPVAKTEPETKTDASILAPSILGPTNFNE